MFRSLWFKLVVTFAVIMLAALALAIGIVDRAAEREYGSYAAARTEYARSLLPTVPPASAWESPPPIIAVPFPTTGEVVFPPRERFLAERPLAESVLMEQLLVEAAQGGSAGPQFLGDIRRTTAAVIIAAGLAAILLITFFFRRFTRPLAHLRLSTQAIAQGNYGARVAVSSNDEVGTVANAFNTVASQLQRTELARRQMVADIAHELRTPLSVIQSNIEAMLDGLLAPSSDELAEIHGEVGRLARMVEDLRLLSLADAGQLQLSPSRLDAIRLIDRVGGLMQPVAEANDVLLQIHTPPISLPIEGDEDKLQQALTNLIDNGLRHAASQVTVTAARAAQTVTISVADDGPGIPAQDLPYVFERFWRGDKSRSRHSGGSGLGLSIVKHVVDLHGGNVQIVSPPSGGTHIALALPAA